MPKLVLIVEDNRASRVLARDVLEASGYETIEAATADDGIARARERPPDLILMDIQLPHIDGITALERLKVDRQQGLLFDQDRQLDALDRSIEEKELEIGRRHKHYEEVRAQLDKERERVLKYLLPKRHAMPGAAQVFPVAIELRLPGGAS